MGVEKYFIEPILYNGGFNPVNSLVLGLILILGVFLVYRFLEKIKVEIDLKFFLGILPFVFWASSTRVLRDCFYSKVIENLYLYPKFLMDLNYNISVIREIGYEYIIKIFPLPVFANFYSFIISWFITPSSGSYLITFLFALISLLIGLFVQKKFKFEYWKIMFIFGFVLFLINLFLLPIQNFLSLVLISLISFLWLSVFLCLRKFPKINLNLVSYPNIGILSSHFLDATATTFAIYVFGYSEQHFLPNMFFPIFGQFSMFLLKILVVLPVLWIIDKEVKEMEFRNFLKIGILILGLAPGLRDMIRIACLV